MDSARKLIEQCEEPFVFIDADKPGNPDYLAAALELTRPGLDATAGQAVGGTGWDGLIIACRR